MRAPATAMSLTTLALLALGVWASGCTDLSNDCELNLNCAPTAPPVECDGKFFPGACDDCLKSKCCGELSNCDADGACMYSCVFGVLPSPPECVSPGTATLLGAYEKCLDTNC